MADNDQFTIDGTVTKFDLQHGEVNDWAVKLGLTDFSGRTNNDPGKSEPGSSHMHTFNGVATGDSTAAAGSWNGVFYGASEETAATDDDDTARVVPVAVVGEFNANFTDGTAAGGYGANKQ